MKAKEFLFEAKRPKIVMPKQRDPNWRTMQAKATSGAGGTHKDQKRAVKQGNVKHKKDLIPMEDQGVAASPRLQRAHDEERQRRGLPHPDEYLRMIEKKKKEIADMRAQDLEDKKKGVSEGLDIGKEWMSDTEIDQYVPDRLQDEWRELVGYDIEGKAHPLWANMTGGYEPDVKDPEDRANMVKVANKWFAMKKIPNVKFYDVKDADDELEWLVQIGQQDVAEGSYTTEKQIKTRIRQIMYDRKLSGTESNAGELNRLKQQLKDIRSQQSVSEGENELYGLRIGDTVTTKINGQTVQGDVIDLFPDDMEVELSLRGPETGKTVVVDVRDTEYFESQDLTVREEETRKSIPELEKEMDTYQAILKKSQEITKSIKYDNIPGEIITEIKMLADQFNIPEEMFKDAIDEIFDARSNLESAVYGLEEPITDRIREIKHAILELEDEEYYKESSMADHKCPSCGGPIVAESMLSEKKDACYYKVKSRYKVWPSAYASGALVQCRKKGAKNWGKG